MNKYHKGFVPILIALIVLILAGVGGISYYLINKQSTKKVACTTEAKICPDGSSVGRTGLNCEFTACPEVRVDETVNWKTYKYEGYGFEIKYPQAWTSNIDKTSGSLCLTSPKKNDGSFVNFWVTRCSLSEGGLGCSPTTLPVLNTTVDGVKAYKDEDYVRNPDGSSTQQSISFEKNGYIYILTFQVFKKYDLPNEYEDIKPAVFTSEEKNIWDKMVSTFKFL